MTSGTYRGEVTVLLRDGREGSAYVTLVAAREQIPDGPGEWWGGNLSQLDGLDPSDVGHAEVTLLMPDGRCGTAMLDMLGHRRNDPVWQGRVNGRGLPPFD